MLALNNVYKSYDRCFVVQSFSLTVSEGAAVCLYGPSGSGKTTLLRLIAGLERPDAGEIEISGITVSGGDAFVPAGDRDLNMVFQDLALWPHMFAQQHLTFVLRGRGLSRSERRARALELLALVDLADSPGKYPRDMSGGEQQRLAIARALATEPKLLLLDEPFAHLDARRSDAIAEEIRERKDRDPLTVVMASHDERDAERLDAALIPMPIPEAD